jgi:hypothetical protein
MSNRTKSIILAVALLQLVLIIGLLALPTVVQAIPGRYRIWLQENQPLLGEIAEGVIEQVAPVPTALPAPSQTGEQIDIASLLGQSAGTSNPAAGVAGSVDQSLPGGRPAGAPTGATPLAESALPTPAMTPTAAATFVAEATATLQPTATLEPTPTVEPTPEPLPERVVLEGMGVIRQSFNNCGPANLTQVLNWYGSDITQEDVASYLKPNPEDRNVSPWQIADYVNEIIPGSGLRALTRAGGSLEMIKQFLAAGYPVVIEKGYDLDSGWWGHYLTVFGYDDTLQEIYSQDTYLGPWDGSGRVDTYEDVAHYWQHFNNTFYVVYRPEQEAEVRSIMGEEMFDDFTMWQNVAAVADEQTRANPDDAFAWFNLGTALTRMGAVTGDAQYYQGGAQAYDRAREIGLAPRMLWYQFEPYLAYLRVNRFQDMIDLADATMETQGGRNVEETFLYKGHALASLGDTAGAIAAYQEALALNENFYLAEIALGALQ